MSSANLELVQSLFTAWERDDFTAADWAHPEIEFVIADGPAAGSWTGLAGMAEGYREILSPMEQYRVVADEYRELDGGRVLVLCHQYGRGKMSGVELEEIQAKAAAFFHIRDGKVTRIVSRRSPTSGLLERLSEAQLGRPALSSCPLKKWWRAQPIAGPRRPSL